MCLLLLIAIQALLLMRLAPVMLLPVPILPNFILKMRPLQLCHAMCLMPRLCRLHARLPNPLHRTLIPEMGALEYAQFVEQQLL